jgi:hypothetical protein
VVLVDTSIWIHHFRSGNDRLEKLLDEQTTDDEVLRFYRQPIAVRRRDRSDRRPPSRRHILDARVQTLDPRQKVVRGRGSNEDRPRSMILLIFALLRKTAYCVAHA